MRRHSISTVIAVVLTGSALVFCTHAGEFHHASASRFLVVLGMACLAARLKLRLPGLDGSMSMNVPFLLLSAIQFSVAEAMLIGGVSTLVQSFPSPGKAVRPAQIVFNVCNVANAVWLASLAFHFSRTAVVAAAAAGAVYFVANTLPVALMIALAEARSILNTYRRVWMLSFPYFTVGTCLAGLTLFAARSYFSSAAVLAMMGVMCGVYASYRMYFAACAQAGHLRSVFAGD